MSREVIPVDEAFFCDGHSYILASSSLGGSGYSAGEIGDKLQAEDSEVIKDLLGRGICAPLLFPGDCALDDVVFVKGDLSENEEDEWIGRLRVNLEIPCGEFMLMGGGLDEHFEVALESFKAPDPQDVTFQKLKVDPGSYLVEVYAFLGSQTANEAWEDRDEKEEPFSDWWKRTRGDEAEAEWIAFFNEEEYVDGEEFELQEYIIRISPKMEDVALPAIHDSRRWCSVYEIRRPEICPRGLPMSEYREKREN